MGVRAEWWSWGGEGGGRSGGGWDWRNDTDRGLKSCSLQFLEEAWDLEKIFWSASSVKPGLLFLLGGWPLLPLLPRGSVLTQCTPLGFVQRHLLLHKWNLTSATAFCCLASLPNIFLRHQTRSLEPGKDYPDSLVSPEGK